MNRVTGILRDWDYNPDGSLIGKIYSSEEFEVGFEIETSPILYFSGNGKYAHNQNAIYELDPPVNLNKNTYDFKRNASVSFTSVNSPAEISVATWKTDEEVYDERP